MKYSHLYRLVTFCLLCLPSAVLGASNHPAMDVEKTESLSEMPTALADAEDARKKPSWFEIHGDYRWLFGEGRFRYHQVGQRKDHKIIMETRRFRLFPVIHVTPELAIKTQWEDNRSDKLGQDTVKSNHHLYMGRLYLEYVKNSFKAEAGRFNYYLADGNVIDKKVDGLRLRYGDSDSSTGRFAFFYGNTISKGPEKKEGFILENRRETGKWLSHLAYLDLKSKTNHSKSFDGSTAQYLHFLGLSAGRSGSKFDRQRIGEWNVAYSPNEDWTFGMDFLYAHGRHKADNYIAHEGGYVASITYGDAKPEKGGTYEIWVRYYNQPQASIIAHTMDGDTAFFQRMSFKGWGARIDYVLTPGLVWAVEGFSLKNKSDGPLTDNFHEYVLGTSVTAYF